MESLDNSAPRRIVIVGGGIAALEAVLALHDLAPQLRVTLIAPESKFTPRPGDASSRTRRGSAGGLDLAGFMDEHGGRFRRTAVLSIDSRRHTVVCATRTDEPYDLLVLAVGASGRPRFQHALTLGADSVAHDELLEALPRVETPSAAFVVPEGTTWPLPLYELALLLAEEGCRLAENDWHLHLVTPERSPLEVLGSRASAAVEGLLRTARITLHRGATATVQRGGRVSTGTDDLEVTLVVALPLLEGPRLPGVPSDANGFIPVDECGRVIGVNDIFAAGDATNGQIKEGGLACRQADAVSAQVARSVVGGSLAIPPSSPVLRGRLLTEAGDRFHRRACETTADVVTALPFWWPQMEASGRYLAPYLEKLGLITLQPAERADEIGFDVRVPLG